MWNVISVVDRWRLIFKRYDNLSDNDKAAKIWPNSFLYVEARPEIGGTFEILYVKLELLSLSGKIAQKSFEHINNPTTRDA